MADRPSPARAAMRALSCVMTALCAVALTYIAAAYAMTAWLAFGG